jgi:purine nucleosidase
VTLLFTGPLTHLAEALVLDPAIESKIERLYFMGGAIDVPGNVLPPFGDGDGSAEWNVYWDPAAAARVWSSSIPITMIGLDATDKVPVTEEFVARLGQQRQYPLSDLAYQCWSLTLGTGYHLWDTLTTLAVAYPELVGVRDVPCAIAVDGPQDGRTFRSPGGRVVQVGFDLEPGRVYQTVLDLLRQ